MTRHTDNRTPRWAASNTMSTADIGRNTVAGGRCGEGGLGVMDMRFAGNVGRRVWGHRHWGRGRGVGVARPGRAQ